MIFVTLLELSILHALCSNPYRQTWILFKTLRHFAVAKSCLIGNEFLISFIPCRLKPIPAKSDFFESRNAFVCQSSRLRFCSPLSAGFSRVITLIGFCFVAIAVHQFSSLPSLLTDPKSQRRIIRKIKRHVAVPMHLLVRDELVEPLAPRGFFEIPTEANRFQHTSSFVCQRCCCVTANSNTCSAVRGAVALLRFISFHLICMLISFCCFLLVSCCCC
mmetsp:Transcript_2674/g.4166  ORF Transcript_2674/g.4166 Transcript_2674/m.4166 type:complete len:218 (-) Transcript_2674:41-694(-)